MREAASFARAWFRDGKSVSFTRFAMIGLDTIRLPTRRAEIAQRLADSGRDIVDLTHEQIGEFAGDAIELTSTNGPVLALSAWAWAALSADQKRVLEGHATVLPLTNSNIALAGGSVRCVRACIWPRCPRCKVRWAGAMR